MLKTYLDASNLGDERIAGRIRAMTERLGVDTFVRQNNLDRKDGAEVLRSFTCPVLILCGENDRLTPVEDHREMMSLVPHAKFVIVEHSGHMTPIENPRAVTQAFLDWLM